MAFKEVEHATEPVRAALLFFVCAAVANADEGKPVDEGAVFQTLPVKASSDLVETWRKQYEGFAEPKALAMALGEDGAWAFGWLEKAPGVLPAIGAALQGCEQARRQKEIATPCEIIRVNDQELELGRAFAKRINASDATPAMVWRFQKNDRTLYLAGSLHVFKSSLYPLPAAYEKAFSDSESLILEVNLAAVPPQDLMKLRQKHLMLPDGKTLDSVLPEPLLEKTKKEIADLGVPWSAVATLTPAALGIEFSQALFMTRGYFPQAGIDQHLLTRALQGGKTVDQLETLEFQLALLGEMPVDLQKIQSRTTLDSKTLSHRPDELLEAWYLGDLQRIASLMATDYDASAELRNWHRRVFRERNEKMADQIAGLLESAPQTKMIVVGTGHLAGDDSIIQLLAQKKITGVRLSRDGSPLKEERVSPGH
ncbi:MAG TPA: TraB/GumN family protein [Povalibacter sp.]|uniref:TraB/GumN family protein n=1 Tax=Povalibacter sp. TaxID=1962978 RepID=UPI002CF7EC24|nr:TraB/GumN family protein [Povalibacter sp.]HMN45406.1 TraB/GumN family protein [Povalibacter sp.]